jgi:hypothetical protein
VGCRPVLHVCKTAEKMVSHTKRRGGHLVGEHGAGMGTRDGKGYP